MRNKPIYEHSISMGTVGSGINLKSKQLEQEKDEIDQLLKKVRETKRVSLLLDPRIKLDPGVQSA